MFILKCPRHKKPEFSFPVPSDATQASCPQCDLFFYLGTRAELPPFFSWYNIPVPRAFLHALFQFRKGRKRFPDCYTEDAFAITRGDTFWSEAAAYDGYWRTVLRPQGWSIQIQSPDQVTLADPDSSLTGFFRRPSMQRTKLLTLMRFQTTQARFLRFLKTGRGEVIGLGEEV